MNEVTTELTLKELEMVEGGTSQEVDVLEDAAIAGSELPYQPNVFIWKTVI